LGRPPLGLCDNGCNTRRCNAAPSLGKASKDRPRHGLAAEGKNAAEVRWFHDFVEPTGSGEISEDVVEGPVFGVDHYDVCTLSEVLPSRNDRCAHRRSDAGAGHQGDVTLPRKVPILVDLMARISPFDSVMRRHARNRLYTEIAARDGRGHRFHYLGPRWRPLSVIETRHHQIRNLGMTRQSCQSGPSRFALLLICVDSHGERKECGRCRWHASHRSSQFDVVLRERARRSGRRSLP